MLNYNIEETIQKESVVINITNQGYIKRGSLAAVKTQKRGGKGKLTKKSNWKKAYISLKNEDRIEISQD